MSARVGSRVRFIDRRGEKREGKVYEVRPSGRVMVSVRVAAFKQGLPGHERVVRAKAFVVEPNAYEVIP